MAVPTGTFQAHSVVGIREDLSDEIYDESPKDTPGLSLFEHFEITAKLYEWQTDALEAADATGAVDGDNAPANSATATVRLNNRTHIRTRDARVSGGARSVTTAGRADELDYQVMKKAAALKRDMEKVLFDNNAKVAGGAATASELAGVPAWLITSTDFAADGADATGDGTDARTDGTQRAFTQDQAKTVLGLCWDAGGNPDVAMVGRFSRQIMSTWSAGKTVVQKAEDPILHETFEVWETDFATVKIVPNRFMRSRDALFLQTDRWRVGFLPGRNMLTFELGKSGDSDARQVLSEFTLEASNEKASAGVFDLTTS